MNNNRYKTITYRNDNTNLKTNHDKIIIYLDFDGVINTFINPNKYTKITGLKTPTTHKIEINNFFTGEKITHKIKCSTEVIDKFTNIANTYDNVEIVWCTTFRKFTPLLEKTLNFTTPTRYLDFPLTTDLIKINYNKLDAITKDLNTHPTPFIWIDDEAITTTINTHNFTTPHLLIATNENVGIKLNDFNKIEDFIKTHTTITRTL